MKYTAVGILVVDPVDKTTRNLGAWVEMEVPGGSTFARVFSFRNQEGGLEQLCVCAHCGQHLVVPPENTDIVVPFLQYHCSCEKPAEPVVTTLDLMTTEGRRAYFQICARLRKA